MKNNSFFNFSFKKNFSKNSLKIPNFIKFGILNFKLYKSNFQVFYNFPKKTAFFYNKKNFSKKRQFFNDFKF